MIEEITRCFFPLSHYDVIYKLHHDFEIEQRFQEMVDFFIDSYGVDKKQYLDEEFNYKDEYESIKQSLLVSQPASP